MNHDALPSAQSIRCEYRFGVLLAALVLIIVHDPIMTLVAPGIHPVTARIVLGIVFGTLMISAVNAVSDQGGIRAVAILLAIPALAAEWVDIGLLRGDSLLLGHTLSVIFLVYTIVVLLRYILACDHIDTNMVFAALCVYLLLGVLWALVYSLLGDVEDRAFSHAIDPEGQMRFGSEGTSLALYFSFVTMTTLGYGDIVPVTSAARSLTTLQAIVGQLYLTVLVAWLVGMHVAHRRFGRDSR